MRTAARPAAVRRSIRGSGAVAALASALLYGLAFPPASLGGCAAVALVPYLIAVRRATAPGAAGLAVLFAVLACATTIGWLPRAAAAYYLQPLPVGVATWLGVALLMIAPAVLGFTFAYRALAALPIALRPLLGAAAWTAAELARTRLLGNPFAVLGATQAGVPAALQIADVTGIYGIGFVLAAVNVGLAEAWLSRRAGWRAAVPPLAAAAACVGLSLGYGAIRLATAPETARAAVPVLLVQGDVDLGTQWNEDLFGRNLDVYLRLTLEHLRRAPVALVLWPENALTFFVADEPLYREAIGRVLAVGGSELVVGGPAHAGGAAEEFFNSAFLLAADGEVRGRYDKQRLIAFAERFPAGFDLLRRRFGRVREFTPGGPAALLPTTAGAAGVLICNEILFPSLARERVQAGAAYLVNLTNDGWIGADYADGALAVAAVRAVEQRRWLLRVSTSGLSAIVDPYGRVRAQARFGSRAALAGSVEPNGEVTPYARLGDAFAVACAAAVGIALAASRRRSPPG